MFNEQSMEMELAGRRLKVSTGKMARQANGSVLIEYGKTALLATATMKNEAKKGIDFLPLTLEYIEKYYAAGKFPGGFRKREARPADNAILTARLMDRPLRPLFPKDFYNEIQIVVTVLSTDQENLPDAIAITAASCALTISDIPFAGPVAGVTVGYIDDQYVANPTPEQMKNSMLDLKVAGTKKAVTMVESGAKELSEEIMLNAVLFGHEEIKRIIKMQEDLQEKIGKTKIEVAPIEKNQAIIEYLNVEAKEKLKQAVLTVGKLERDIVVNKLEEEIIEKYFETKNISDEKEISDITQELKKYYHDLMKDLIRDAILFEKHRADGRKVTEIRPIVTEVDTLPNVHGSALFTRGETQSLGVVTLGTKEDEQIIDGLEEESRDKFLLHYNFPPYSVGEVGRIGFTSRRELGHGALAKRALEAVMPKVEDFPYTIRVVSEILESNGSSSMATVCSGSMSLMAAGVPIKNSVAGIAMGLIKEGEDFVVLSDIMGLEDHLGDMDFKVAGTKNGITALQMDIKIEGITTEIMKTALIQALEGRRHILSKMEEAIVESRNELAANAPRIVTLTVKKDKISALIGPGGKNIKMIIEKSNSKIDIADDGSVNIFAVNESDLAKAVNLIENFTKEVKVGEIYYGKVVKIMNFGAFVEILPGQEGLLHISEVVPGKRIAKVEDELKEGEEIKIIIKGIENGKMKLGRLL